MKISKKKVAGAIFAAGVMALFAAGPTFADGTAFATNRGAESVFTSANNHLTVIDMAYDGWGAYSHLVVGNYNVLCIDERGYNTSATCTFGAPRGNLIQYNSCLEHNNGATTAYCSGDVLDVAR